jgi:DNA-binding NarL/FixJ family response regulator
LKNKINILIADDHEITRAGIKLLLSYQFKYQVIAEASNGNEAVALTVKHEPDIVLLDINMPESNGLYAAKQIKKHRPDTKIILLTGLTNNVIIDKALTTGADGYLLKNMKSDEIIDALNKVMTGKKVYSQSVLKYIENKKLNPIKHISKPISFTKNELKVLKLLSNGLNNIQIAEELGITSGTVYLHLRKLRKKTGTENRTGLIKYAIINNK